ncbi:fumarylacetoacetate hydrolase family protein [Halorarius halobius]|uniref:fumarylacetoacetate hydrolase family protein n=1 Tax=Halorarius halobius TaxID=2962671 RepID=UPI0020CDEF84|nr:fumarylacetoacetate hydrolase family protein [Halorarius halobius]
MTKYARARTDAGVIEGTYADGVVTADGEEYVVGEDCELLAPCEPSAFYCVGRNFGEKVDQMDYEIPDEPDFFIKGPTSLHHPDEKVDQMDYEIPDEPDFFIKGPTSLHHPDEPIPYPSFTEELTYAGELAAVVGRECHDIAESEVDEYVRGYTILNDLDCLDQERRTARKAFDHSAPLGPVVADVDPVGLDMTTHINGEKRQEDNTENMFIKPREVVSFLSERFTFRPGDVISFGSPANPGLVEPGDEIVIEYEDIGRLRNTVA